MTSIAPIAPLLRQHCAARCWDHGMRERRAIAPPLEIPIGVGAIRTTSRRRIGLEALAVYCAANAPREFCIVDRKQK